MKRMALAVLLLFLLVACADEFPPSPPPPGEEQIAGRAYGGIPISPGQLPRWAAEIKYTDIDPTQVKAGDTVKVVVTKPSAVKTKFYVHAIAYAYNKKFKFWEKVFADTGQSGKILKNWADEKAMFNIPISTDRFLPGPNYVVIYWCIDTEKRDDKGFKIWDCQGNKWQLGSFEMLGVQYPDILIEKDIENNRYKSSSKVDDALGQVYTASYEHLNGVKTDVSVLVAKNVEDFKKTLVPPEGIASIEAKWIKRGNVCGFLESIAGKVMFGWLSGGNWITVTTYSSTVDDAKIGVYGIKYPSDCDLLNKLKAMAPPPVSLCGNGKVDIPEQCDGSDDSACPGACRPDCTCMLVGDANFGFCGDNIIQKPNKDGVTEDCEPPGSRDPVTGQLISSACFLRNALGQITGLGACDDKCKCIDATFIKSACGNGKAEAGEQCGDTGTPGCAAGNMCVNCKCVPVPNNCGNGAKDAGEQCDPGVPGAPCPAGQMCSANCLCVKGPQCGDGKVTPPEQCEKAADCPNGLPGTFKACLACGCAYFGWPAGGCGDGSVDKAAGEECEKDQDCANPPGGIVSPLCNKQTCKCNKVCGDGKIDAPNDEVPPKNEQCDPPGKPGVCPPIRLPDGGCAIPLCQNDCTCPAGQPCPQPVGCGNGILEAGEECEKPGDWCGCAIGAETVECLICDSACKCGPAKADSPCRKAGGNDCGPVHGVTYEGQTGTFYTLGTRYPMFDNSNAVAGDLSFKGTQCGEVCVSTVVKLGAVDTDGSDVRKDGSCYYVSQASAISATGQFSANAVVGVGTTADVTSPSPTPLVAKYYTITKVKSACISATRVSEPVVRDKKCILRTMDCPSGTVCSDAASGAACVPVAATPVPSPTPTQVVQKYVWTPSECSFGACPSIHCTTENAGYECPFNAWGSSCTKALATYYTLGTKLTCLPGTPSYSPPVTESLSSQIVSGTYGCRASTANCFSYYTGGMRATACNTCYAGCCVTYSCSTTFQLVEQRSPANCVLSSPTGSAVVGHAVFNEAREVVASKGIQIALFLIAAIGILLITLLNFVHKE
ncbi:MAG: hypothetical protein QW165_01930 [Candidatus Woesearchaeota archaeon]